ncbi:MAG TPA: hypothetical protein PLO37_22155 [Candidatus Hydrogenedentes bacterium]|nr:hypothetical protein [Candidatus Hydrogenedentota bacterium]HPG69560.1 hypothetical protein [Candidatus Hydrogenedentota bacterium]
MKAVVGGVLVLAMGMCASREVVAAETDQFLVWGRELRDSSEALNRYFNSEIESFLEEINAHRGHAVAADELTLGVFLHFFRIFCDSRLKDWIQHSGEVDRYPAESVGYWEYRQMSIYRELALPFVIAAMSPTIRVGEVYLGVDKISHFFGFGRRYYSSYLRLRGRGLAEQEAVERVLLRGVLQEQTFFGGATSGIFSGADLEANYQGLLLARNLCGGATPYIEKVAGAWRLVRPVDFRDYVTPDFDESYNCPRYWDWREGKVLPLIEEQYATKLGDPGVQARLATYREHEPSLCMKVIAEHFDGKKDPMRQITPDAWMKGTERAAVRPLRRAGHPMHGG